jgi:hypothetical protein
MDARNMVVKEWLLREEIFTASHRWPLILLFIFAGSLLGWTASMLWPAPYQASSNLSVGLDPYRAVEDSYVPAFASTEFRNPDDYKHWQMSQFSVLAFSDEYLQDTLDRLKVQDPAWENMDVPGLRSRVSVDWRNAGRWQLAARAEDPLLAAQLVEAWQAAILQKTSLAVARSQQIYLLDLEQRAIQAEQVDVRLQAGDLSGIQKFVSGWQEDLAARAEGDLLRPEERARLEELGASLLALEPGWQELVAAMPDQDSTASEHLSWIEGLDVVIDQKVRILAARLESLEEEGARVSEEWQAALQEGRGLSATLTVQATQDSSPEISQPRPAGTSALVGGLLGFLAWAFYQLAYISRRTRG